MGGTDRRTMTGPAAEAVAASDGRVDGVEMGGPSSGSGE